jgi:hypothetical protein
MGRRDADIRKATCSVQPATVADTTCNVHIARYRRQVRTDEKQHTAHAKAATKLLNLALQQGVKEAQVRVNRPGHC